jgi:hypothetical protein
MDLSENHKLFMSQHEMIGTMFQYPPFSTDAELYYEAEAALSLGEDLPDLPFEEIVNMQLDKQKDVMQKYGQEFEEASLWMARFPFDADEATDMAMSMDGKSKDEIEIHLATRG